MWQRVSGPNCPRNPGALKAKAESNQAAVIAELS
jgi:hypothetical protein